MSNCFRVIVLAALCICSMSINSDAAQSKKSQPSTGDSTQKTSVLSNDLLSLEKAEAMIKKEFKICTIKSGVLQEGNRAYIWVYNDYNYSTYQVEFHHYNDGTWMLHSFTQESKLPNFVHKTVY
jgi:hypothetical protein